jgi:hypothetical protein
MTRACEEMILIKTSNVRAPWQPVCHSDRRLLYEGYMAALQGMCKLLALLRREKEERGVSLLSLGRSGADQALSLGGPSQASSCLRCTRIMVERISVRAIRVRYSADHGIKVFSDRYGVRTRHAFGSCGWKSTAHAKTRSGIGTTSAVP